MWISRVQHSDLMILLARTTPLDRVSRKSEGMSIFIVDIKEAVGKGMTVKPILGLAHPSIAPYGVFRTRDDRRVLISIQSDREWLKFCAGFLKQPEKAVDPLFATNVARVANRAETDALVASAFAVLTEAEARALLAQADIAFAAVNDMAALSAHPHLRRITVETAAGPVACPVPAPIFAGEDRHYGPVPALGQHRAIPKR